MNMSNKNPLISVVMLNYNGLKYLKRTIPPILKLDYPNYEFIIVDNGSTDGSIEFIKKHKKIRLIQSPIKREKSYACNYAIKKSNGKYILLLDNDLLIIEQKILVNLLKMYVSLSSVGEIGLSTINDGEFKTDNYGDFFSYYYVLKKPFVHKNFLRNLNGNEIGFSCGQGLFIKRDIWIRVRGYDTYINTGNAQDDHVLGIKLLLNGRRNYIYTKSTQIHLGIPERKNNTKYSIKLKESVFGNLFTILCYFNWKNILITIPTYSIFALLKSIKQSMFRLSLRPFFAFFKGYYFFLKNLPIAIQKRKEIQSKRVIKDDIFLQIKPPKFD